MELKSYFSRMAERVRPTVWLPAVAILIYVGLYLPGVTKSIHFSLPTPNSPLSTPAYAGAPMPANGPVNTAYSANTKQCSPLYFPSPSSVDLDSTADGLTTRFDSPTHYPIYGNTAGQLRNQIMHCAPGSSSGSEAEFTSITSYRLNWAYKVTSQGSACSLSDVKVGLHTAIALPAWRPTQAATNGLGGRWQSFMTALSTHEQGHVAIDRDYAGKIVDDLNSIQNVNCSTISDTADYLVHSDVATLNAANDSYDSSTGHGASQGAVLPSY